MALDPAGEPPIDISLAHYLEERALAIALDKAATPQQREKAGHLVELRHTLLQRRDAFHQEATARRHARGEVYSKARVAAINAMGPSLADLESQAKTLYLRQPDLQGVLAAHARAHFAYGLVSARLLLSSHPADIADAAREMHAHEEAFAAAWIAAIGDEAFETQLRRSQREALSTLRTSTRPMHVVIQPPSGGFDDADADALGKAWNKLDELAQMLGAEPLSNWIALPGEDDATAAAAQVLATVGALIEAVDNPDRKFPGKRATLAVLAKVRDQLAQAAQAGGRACFEVDI